MKIVPLYRRRRAAPVLIVSLVGISAGLLGSIGVYSDRQWAATQPSAPPSGTEGKQSVLSPAQPIKSASSLSPVESPSENPVDAQTLLAQAQDLADRGQWTEAIAALASIPENSPVADPAKNLRNSWSDLVLKHAQRDYNSGDLDQALSKAARIPETSAFHTQAQRLIEAWMKDKKTEAQIELNLTVRDVLGSRNLLPQIRSQGLWEKLRVNIEAIEAQVLEDAKIDYFEGNLDDALKKAQAIPQDSPSHAEAQDLIALWNAEKMP